MTKVGGGRCGVVRGRRGKRWVGMGRVDHTSDNTRCEAYGSVSTVRQRFLYIRPPLRLTDHPISQVLRLVLASYQRSRLDPTGPIPLHPQII